MRLLAVKYHARIIELMPSQSPFWVTPVIEWGFLVYWVHSPDKFRSIWDRSIVEYRSQSAVK